MIEQYHKWYSQQLSQDMEMLVFGDRGYPVILFPTSMGRYHENKDFKLIESAAWFVNEGLVKIYCIDSVDKQSWYNKGIHPADRVRTHMAYDQMLYQELAPWAMHETEKSKVCVAGCSFGGYHAANFAFKHPDRVSHLYSMSGAFDIRGQLDGFFNDDAYYNNPIDFVRHATDPALWQLKIILGTSDQDICKESNLVLSAILNGKGISHWLDVRPNAVHDWSVWREMFPHYLSQI
ncbi:esterase family protein [Rufibacter sp. XAAS-G3-1]|uniref:esterase family protein n=1 Tax=Rufibacter sp. XAAS-G3-1 TaxID=2729134 RepID=UPI0015E7CBD0|nr:alpha/beta fold hydrolase [Rufibacter sp. XAAS-G3-1]